MSLRAIQRRHWSTKPQALVERLRHALGKWWPAFNWPMQVPRRNFSLEPLEPRLLLSANITYGNPLDALYDNDPPDSLPAVGAYLTTVLNSAVANLTTLDFTLKAESNSGAERWALYKTGTSTLITQAPINSASDLTLNLTRDDLGLTSDTGLNLKDFVPDTLRIDLGSLDVLEADYTGGAIQINFDGGSQVLSLLGIDDDVLLEGSVDLAMSLGVKSNTDIELTNVSLTAQAITIDSAGVNGGLYDDIDEILAGADSSVLLDNSDLSATGGITLKAKSNVTANSDGFDLGSLSIVGVASFSSSKVELKNGSTVNAGGALALTAEVAADIDAITGTKSVKVAGVLGSATPEVIVTGGTLSSGAGATLSATSNLNILASTVPTGSTSSTSDAAVAIIGFDSSPKVELKGGAALTVTSGTTALIATNNVVMQAMADGRIGGSAGGTLGVSALLGDTEATVNGATITSAGAVTISAISVRTLTTTAIATPDGAKDSGSNSNESEKRLDDPNKDGDTSDQAKTGDGGSVGFAAAVGVTILTGDSLATVNNAGIFITGPGANITLSASADNDTTTTGNGSAINDSGSGVGVGVAIAVADVGAEAWIKGNSDLDANSTVNVTATLPQSNFIANAKSGASGGSSGLGVAGALVVNVTLADAKAGVFNGANVDLNGSSLVVSATSTTDSNGKAEAGAAGGGSSLGLGASVVINYVENNTLALVDTNATLNNSLGGSASNGDVGNVTLTATSDHGMKTEAVGGSAGGTAITPVAALSFATYNTEATLRSDGQTLVLNGNLGATATHTDDVETTATGKTTGDTAIGASFALAVHGASAMAQLQRDVQAGGNVGLTANNRSNTKTNATASAKGSDDNGGSVDSQADNQRSQGDSAGTSRGGSGSSGTGDTPSASSSEGNVAVAAAVAINVVNSDAKASVGSSRTVNAGGNVALLATLNSDAEAIASGEAATDGSVGVGAAVALNFVDADNLAEVGGSAVITADGLSVIARMNDVGSETPDVHTTKSSATSGAAGKDVGVAGSVSVNVVDVNTTARTGSSVALHLNAGDVTVQAVSTTASDATSAPQDTGVEADVGIGASVAFQSITTVTLSSIGSGGTVSGTADDLKVQSTASHTATTTATHGASGDSAAIGGSVAIAVIDHQTLARVESGGAFNSLTGDVDVTATHGSTVTTATKADVKSNSVGVGAGVGINYDVETVDAKLARSVNTNNGHVNVITAATVTAVATGTASASGGDDSDSDADTESDKSVNDNANNGSDKPLPKAADSETAGDDKASSESGSGSSGGASGVGIAAAISVNAVFLTASAETASGADITASGAVTVAADASLDAKAQTDAMAVDFTNGDVNIGAAVSLNYVVLNQTAQVGAASAVTGASVTVRAETIGSQRNDFSATSYAAGGNSSGSAAIAGTLGLNVVNYTVRAYSADTSSLNATGGGVTVSAEHDMGVLAGAVSGSVSADGVAVGGSVAMNFINIGDNPALSYDRGTFASIGDGAGGGTASANAAGTVTVKTDTLVDTVQLDLPGKLNDFDEAGPETDGIADPDIHMSSLAIAAGGSGGNAGVAGSVSFNWFNVISEALVDAGTVGANALVVRADDEVNITSVAGSIGVGASGAGVGAGLDLVILNRFTNARVGSGAVVTLGSGASSVEAESDETLIGVSANIGVGNSAGVAGSASVHVINVVNGAGSYAQVAGQVDGTGDFRIDASADFTDKMIAGSVGVGSTAGVGVANTTVVHTNTARAGIADGGRVALTGAGADVVIEATTTESLLGIAATASAAGTAAVGGSVAVGVINQNTDAYVGRSATVNSTGGNVDVLADADTVLTAVAGNVAFSGTASVGVAVDVGVVNKSTTARMESNTVANVGGNLSLVATSSEDITSVVAGLAVSGSAAVSVNPSIHSLNITTLAYIGDDATENPVSSGPGDVDVNGSIEITADDATEIDKVSAGLAASGAAGIGLAANISVVNKRTEAFIGAGAKVDARGFGSGVDSALGVITAAKSTSTASTQHASTADPLVANGSAQGVGDSANVGVGSVDGGDSADEAQDDVQTSRTTQLGSFGVQGIAISATNRDDIASYAAAVGIGGGAGVGVGGAVTVFNTNTRAYVDDGAHVNSPNTGANGAQSVRIGAGNDFEMVGVVVGAGGGTVGVGVALGITVLNATTEAFIDTGAVVRAANDVTVDARSAQDAVLVDASLGAGFVGVGGSVGVLTLNDTVKARIGSNAVVSAGDTVSVRAHNQTDTTTVDGGVAGGFVGVGMAVGVLVVTKDTTASIDAGAQVDALGGGSGVGNTLNGDFENGDTADGFARTTATGLVVQATSEENVLHVVVAGAGGFVGVGGAVGVVVIDSDTTAEIGAAQINQNNLGGAGQDVSVLAGNETRLRSIRGGVGGGFVGVGAAVDVGVLRNDVGAFIRGGANVRAGDDVTVDALAIKELDGFTAAAGGGAVGVSGSVSVWSVGTDTTSGYDADGNGSLSADEKPGEDGGKSADEDAGDQAGKSLQGSRDGFSGYGGGANAGDPSNRSRTEAQTAATGANTRLGGSDLPSQSNISSRYNAPATLSGTQAIIEGGANVQAGAAAGVTGDITVHAKADVEIDMFNGQLAIGAVGAGGAVGIVSIQEKVEAVAGGTLSADGAIDVYAHLDSEMYFISVAGNGGAVALGASVVVLTDTSVVLAKIGESAVIDNASSVNVKAETDRRVTSENYGITVGFGLALGASVGVIDIGGQVSASVGQNARIGQDVNFNGNVGALNVTADANEYAEIDTTALAGGVGLSVTANFGDASITTAVKAELASGAKVTTSGNALVLATSVMEGDVDVIGVAVGGGALAATIGTVTITPTVTGAARSNARLESTGGTARLRASHNESSNPVSNVGTMAGSGGIIAGSGSSSTVTHDAVVLATAEGGALVLAGGTAELSAYSGARADADAGSLGIGALAMGTSVAEGTVGGSVKAEFGGTTLSGQNVVVRADTDLAAKGTTVATVGGVIGASTNHATATVDTGVTARVASGTVTASNNITVESDANARATADSGGIETDDGADFPNLSLLGGVGLSASDAKLNSTVKAEIGAANASAGNTLLVKAAHNEGNDQKAQATSSASGGSLGVTVSGADADATSSADVYATVGANGHTLHGGSSIQVVAVGVNHARAITNSLGLGLVAGIGVSDSTAITNGNTEARVADGSGSGSGSHATLTGGGLTVNAKAQDRTYAFSEAGAGGIATGDVATLAVGTASPNVIAEIGAYSRVNVGGAVNVHADAAAESDASAEGVEVSGLLSIGGSDATARITGETNGTGRVQVFARIDDGANVDAGSASVRALFNTSTLRNELGALFGSNGDSRAFADISSGSAAAAPDANSHLSTLSDVNAIIGTGTSVTTTGSIALLADGRAHLSAYSDTFQFGVGGAFGAADAITTVDQDIDAVVNANAVLNAGGAVTLNATESTYQNGYGASSGGGIFASAADADVYATVTSTVNTAFGAGATVNAGTNIIAEAKQAFSGDLYGYAESYSGGGAAVSEQYFTVTGPAPGVPTLTTSVGANANLFAKDAVKLSTLVDGGTVGIRGYAYFGGAIGYADADLKTSLNNYGLLTIDSGALVTGEDLVDIRTEFKEVYQDSNPNNGNEGGEAIAVSLGAGNVAWRYYVTETGHVVAAADATVATRDLQVRSITEAPAFDSISEAVINEGGTNAFDDERYEGIWNADRQISFDSDVILLSGEVPELVVLSNGFIETANNVTVTDGGVDKGEGGTIGAAEFTVNPIVNNNPGHALIETNAISNPFSQPDDMDDGEATLNGKSQVFGNDGTWYARRTFDTVTLVNNSPKKMIITDIFPIDRDGDPDGEVFINVDDRAPSGKDPFNFRIINQFEPTLITITSTSFNALADIKFAGTIDNPIGNTVVTSNSDILSDGSQVIRTNLAKLNAVGDIGSLAGNVGASARTALSLDLVQSSGRPELLDATAGGNIVLDVVGLKRDLTGLPYTVNLGTLDAGRNVDVFMRNGRDESNPPASVGSYSLIIDENLNGGLDDNGFTNTPDPLPYIQFFKPDDPVIVFDFWKNLVAPLGVFGAFKQDIEATYNIVLAQAGRLVNGADIQLNGELTGVDVNITAVTNIYNSTTGLLYALTDGDVWISELTGDMRLGRVKSSEGDVELTVSAGANFDIIDVESADHLSTGLDSTAVADVTGRNITMHALNGFIGEPCIDLPGFPPVDFIEIDSSFSGSGNVNAEAQNDIYLDELSGAMNLGLIKSFETDVDLHTRAGDIIDGNAGANNIEAHSIDLVTVGGGVGTSGNDVEMDTDAALGGATNGRLYATANANGAADAGIYLTETDDSLDVLRALTNKGTVRLTVPDTVTVPFTIGDAFALTQGENLVLLTNGETLECAAVADGRIQAERDVLLRVGDNVEMTSKTTNFILAGRNIDIFGDYGNADAGAGTIMNLRGEITSDYTSAANAKQLSERSSLFGANDNDRFNYWETKLGGDTYNYGSASVATGGPGNDGEDRFFVDRLQDLTTVRGTYIDSHVNVLPVRDALTLDGQDQTDTTVVVTHGSMNANGGLGGISDYLINALDTGAANDGVDTLTIEGSGKAITSDVAPNDSYDDVFLLRGESYLPGHDDGLNSPTLSPKTAPVLAPAFVALMHGDLDNDIRALGGNLAAQASNPGSPYLKVERVNYDQAMNGRLTVYGYGGNDYFASDDNSVITTLDGGAGKDSFQIGQLYRSEREYGNVADANDFAAGTVQTTRGYLSRGISSPLTAYGGTGNDSFSVYSNKAELRLEGNDGNDEFIVRAFALQTGQGGDGQTLINGGDGDDNIQYNINAPVSIDGGAGFDRVVALGTEFSDNFVITEDGIYGAGLKIKLAGNEELREVDGLEGNDNFWVLGTPFDVATRIIGGLGSDDVNTMGDVTGIVVSRDLEGVSSTIEHQVTADPILDPFYNNLLARGVDLNIATASSGQIVIDEPDGRTVVSESALLGSTTDFYNVYLSSSPTAAVYITVSAARTTQQEEDGSPAGDTFLVSTDGVNFHRAIVLTFNAGQSGSVFQQQVFVKAVNDTRAEGPRTAVISHSSISADANFNFVATRNVEARIIDDDKAGIYVEESFAEYDNGTQVLEGAAPFGITDTYSLRLASAPSGNTAVQLAFDAAEITVTTADARYNAGSKTVTYSAANWFSPVVFTLAGIDDGVSENREIVPIIHTVTASTDIRYVNPGTPGPDVAAEKLKVSVVDTNSEGVLVTESFGRTLVVQDNPNTAQNETTSDTYQLRLTKAPVGTVTITTIALSLPDKDGGLVQTVFTLPVAVNFTAANWNTPQTITITPNPDFQPAPGTEYNKYFSKRPHTTSELFGPLEVLGGVGPEDRSLVPAIVLPGETNSLTSDGNVLTFSGSFAPGALNTMTVEKADLLAVVNAAVDDVDELADLVGFSLMISKGNGLDRFWRINALVDNGNGTMTLTLENPGRMEAIWNISGPPNSASEYAVLFMSSNFFVDEATQIDKLNVFNDTSVANDVGTVTSTQISGLGMGPGVGFDTNEDNIPDLFFASGISYATYTDSDNSNQSWFKDIEVLDLMLGRGNDTLTVQNTLQTTAQHGGLTVIHGGGNTPVGGVMGGDTINVVSRKTAGVLGSPIVVFGDTSADGYRYNGQSGVKSPNAMNFAFAGRDTLDANLSQDSVTMFGGGNNDLLIGSQAGDTLAGGSGDDRIFGQQGNDHIYGDSGINIDVNSRKLVSGMGGPTLVDQAFDALNPLIEKTGHDRAQSYAAGQLDDLTATLVGLARPTWADSLDSGADLLLGQLGNDIAFGDHGVITQFWATSIPQNVRVVGTGTGAFGTANERLVESRSNTNGKGDTIFGNEGDDVLIGGAAGDRADGNAGADLVFGDNVQLDRTGHVGDPTNPRFRVLIGTQMYSISGANNAGQDLATGAWQANPDGTFVWTDFRVDLLDHSFADQSAGLNNFGNDYLAGGADDDQIFGQLGNDTIQGDGSIGVFTPGVGAGLAAQLRGGTSSATASGAARSAADELVGAVLVGVGDLTVNASTSNEATDGDDYIEGNGGNDVIFGNLGQDDIVGGNSTMFGEDTRPERPDGGDMIFGGSGELIERDRPSVGDTVGTGTSASGFGANARDADTILGDNGDIHRLVGVTLNGVVVKATNLASSSIPITGDTLATSRGYLAFNYDANEGVANNGAYDGALRIVPRTATLVDYTPGGPDFVPASLPNGQLGDYGAADEIHGGGGDDTVYGMTGNDIVYGDGQNDDLIGGWGADWISGGTGDDGVLGDDGRLFTSRNSATFGEALYGVVKLVANDPSAKDINGNVINEAIYTPGNVQNAVINKAGELKKTVDLTPWNLDSNGGIEAYQNPAPAEAVPHDANDVMFGGLGNDWLHGGAGDDAISGAEALTAAYTQVYNDTVPGSSTLAGKARSDWNRPYNTGDVLRFSQIDITNPWHKDPSARSGEFAFYDEYDPLRRIMLNSNGTKWATGPITAFDFLLNFNQTEGVAFSAATTPDGVAYPAVNSDGDDKLFGDLGNDWLVGGTGRDDAYGGFGNDLINTDDNHTTNGNLNDQPDTAPTYEDRAYGGAGRDVLIANTGGDRLIDWVGEFNTYLVPFAPFGTATVSRTLQPQLSEFLYALSASDGADQTRRLDEGTWLDAARNGEPRGELGLLRQQDDFFHDQTGAPADPQAGNIPGGKRDVLRSATFENNTPQNLLADSGTWQAASGVLQVASASAHSDAVAVYQVGDRLPTYFEVTAKIQTIKPTAGWNANSFVIFDYVSYSDFKFAGIDVSTNKLVIGHRDASGWVYDKQTPFQGKSDTWYDVLLSVNGGTAIVVVNGTSLSNTYVARVLDSVSYGLNWGLVGFGSNNARGAIDNIAVQVLPPQTNIVRSDDFSTNALAMFGNASAGAWALNAGRYAATPPASSGLAFTMLDMSNLQRLTSTAALDLNTIVKTAAGRSGFVFDRYDNGDFKWAGFDVDSKQALIGHYTARSGWVVDSSVAFASLAANADFTVSILIKGSTVSLNVAKMSGTTVVASALTSFVFNSAAVDGGFGLMAKGGAASFDVVTAKTDDTTVPQLLSAASAVQSDANASATVTETDLATLAGEALRRWSLSEDAALVESLRSVKLQVADLPEGELARYQQGSITVDDNAAGWGWFVDASTQGGAAFSALGSGAAGGRMDLLSTLLHEYGHAAGLGHDESGLMHGSLTAGTRPDSSLAPWRHVDAAAAPAPGNLAIDWSSGLAWQVDDDVDLLKRRSVGEGWRGRFVGDLAAPAWGASPNSRWQIQLPKALIGGAM